MLEEEHRLAPADLAALDALIATRGELLAELLELKIDPRAILALFERVGELAYRKRPLTTGPIAERAGHEDRHPNRRSLSHAPHVATVWLDDRGVVCSDPAALLAEWATSGTPGAPARDGSTPRMDERSWRSCPTPSGARPSWPWCRAEAPRPARASTIEPRPKGGAVLLRYDDVVLGTRNQREGECPFPAERSDWTAAALTMQPRWARKNMRGSSSRMRSFRVLSITCSVPAWAIRA